MKSQVPFKPLYPDVVGAITGGPRVNMEDLECALGVFPRRAYINQPFEVVVVLQSMIDVPAHVKVGVRVPTKDRDGEVAIIDLSQSTVNVTLEPGEVGVLSIPIIARPPTKPGKDYPIRIAIRYRADENRQRIRPPGGGVPPSVLSVSHYKLQALQEIEYVSHKWNESTEILSVYFDLVPKNMPNTPQDLKSHYEPLWTHQAMREEVKLARTYYDEAMEIAKSAADGSAYLWMLEAVEERFAKRGMPLHPGESKAIAKIMTYTVDEALTREPDIVLEETRWFKGLCAVLARDPNLLRENRNELISEHVFEGVMYEATLLAFRILRSRVKENLGTRDEQFAYADRLLTWFAGHGEADLSYVYLPLVLCGVVVARWVRTKVTENPWDIVDELIEAYHGRARLITGATDIVFDMLDDILEQQQRTLRAQRIERPTR